MGKGSRLKRKARSLLKKIGPTWLCWDEVEEWKPLPGAQADFMDKPPGPYQPRVFFVMDYGHNKTGHNLIKPRS